MPRAKRGFKARRRRNKILKEARGFRGGQSKTFRQAAERVNRAMQFAYRDRRVRKRDFRSLWIVRIGAAVQEHGISYSRFIFGLKELGIDVNRKMLAEMAVNHTESFKALATQVKAKLAA